MMYSAVVVRVADISRNIGNRAGVAQDWLYVTAMCKTRTYIYEWNNVIIGQ